MNAATSGKGHRFEIEVDDAVRALDQVEHIVVLMMENRSFDHMLGYLRLSGRRPELDGLQAEMANVYHDRSGKFPQYDGLSFGVHELLDTRMTKAQDPPHGGSSVDKQLVNDNGGFVQTYMDERGGPTEVHPGDVMGYHTDRHLPVYDHLSREVLRLRPLVQLGCGLDVPQPALLDGRPSGREARERPSADLPPALVLPPSRRRQGRLLGDLRARRDADRVGGRQRLSVPATCSTSTSPGSTDTSGRRTSATRSSSGRRQGSCRASPGSTRASPTCAQA